MKTEDKQLFGLHLTVGWRLVMALIWGLSLFGLTLLALPTAELQADGPDAGYIVVQLSEHNTIVRPISFTAPISGLAALELTGLEIITTATAFGPSVCAIAGVGDSAANCFGTGYWAYSFWNGSDWEGYMVGAGSSAISDGAIELWAWSPGYVSPATPGSGPQFASAARATRWLAEQQSATDGGYGNASNSIEMLMALGGNGYTGPTWRRGANAPSLSGYVLAKGAAYSTNGAAATGKLAVGLSGGGGCYPFNALRPSDTYSATSGIYTGGYGAGGGGPQAWGILGDYALNQTAPAAAVTYLKNAANTDGGWGWATGSSDTNGTALAIQALVAAGEPVGSSAIISGLTYLKSAQNSDGGFPYDPHSSYGTASDTNSTAYVVQAIVAAGQNPLTGTWLISNTNPISYLLGMQLSDGSFEWQSGTGANQISTQQAVPALLGRALPIQTADVAHVKPGFSRQSLKIKTDYERDKTLLPNFYPVQPPHPRRIALVVALRRARRGAGPGG
jgi:hypothetical protein